ncbi:hypothetical protein ACFWP1_38630 [Streptomyces sp. NPDC058425]
MLEEEMQKNSSNIQKPLFCLPAADPEKQQASRSISEFIRGIINKFRRAGSASSSPFGLSETGTPSPGEVRRRGFSEPQQPGPLARQVLQMESAKRMKVASNLLDAIRKNPKYRAAYEEGRLPVAGGLAGEAWELSLRAIAEEEILALEAIARKAREISPEAAQKRKNPDHFCDCSICARGPEGNPGSTEKKIKPSGREASLFFVANTHPVKDTGGKPEKSIEEAGSSSQDVAASLVPAAPSAAPTRR